MLKRQLSTGTDWEHVKREAAQDAPKPHAANDGPYDPAATAAYWQTATVKRGRGGLATLTTGRETC